MVGRVGFLVAVATLWLSVVQAVVVADELDRAIELVQRNEYALAVPLLRRLAEEGDGSAQAYYGSFYLMGVGGLPRDPSIAKRWFERAALRGNATAAFNLGLMAEQGDTGARDQVAAVRWYREAALSGFPMAMLKVGQAYREGWGVQVDHQEAARWLRLSARAGDEDAQNLLGVMIARGETSGTNVEAYAWFKIAQKHGQPEAERNMVLLRPFLSAEEIAEGDRHAEAWRAAPGR